MCIITNIITNASCSKFQSIRLSSYKLLLFATFNENTGTRLPLRFDKKFLYALLTLSREKISFSLSHDSFFLDNVLHHYHKVFQRPGIDFEPILQAADDTGKLSLTFLYMHRKEHVGLRKSLTLHHGVGKRALSYSYFKCPILITVEIVSEKNFPQRFFS